MGNLQKRNFRYSLKRFLTLLVSLYHALSALFKNNLNICMKNEPVTAGAEQRYMSGCWALGSQSWTHTVAFYFISAHGFV